MAPHISHLLVVGSIAVTVLCVVAYIFRTVYPDRWLQHLGVTVLLAIAAPFVAAWFK